jgi:threonine/homoserine/homoserine lactone efflux protein
MSLALPAVPVLAAFGVASLVLAATPGPGVLYIVTRTLAQGRRAGLASVAGVALGNLGNAMGASLGLAALLAVSSLAFNVVKYAGAAYLVWLGIKALRDTTVIVAASAHFDAPQHARILRDGFVVALLNPKTALFFAAFLPQFMTPNGSVAWQSALFGAAFVAIAACTDTAYVLAAGVVGPRLRGHGRLRTLGRRTSALVYVGLGALTALSDPRPR